MRPALSERTVQSGYARMNYGRASALCFAFAWSVACCKSQEPKPPQEPVPRLRATDTTKSKPSLPQAFAVEPLHSATGGPTSKLSDVDGGDQLAPILHMVRDCLARSRRGSRGVHGSPLQLEKARVTRPSQLRARGEKGRAASLSDDHRVVWIPESSPFDQRIPNGVGFTVNLRTGACTFPKYVR